MNDTSLQKLLDTDKAKFVKVQHLFTRDIKTWRYQLEVFVYFSSEKIMKKSIETPVKIGKFKHQWEDKDNRRCRQYYKLGHIKSKCEIFQEIQKTKEHMQVVRNTKVEGC